MSVTAPLLVVDDLRVSFGSGPVVDGVSFALAAGECVAIVGESGSGKSVTSRALLGLTGGAVSSRRLTLGDTDLAGLGERAWRRVRGARVGLVLQDALVSLDPLRPIGREIDDALRLHTRLTPRQRRERALEALVEVGMPDPEARLGSRSGELSGGLRQRALIAAALAVRPELVVADEPTTALDAEVQRVVVDRLRALRDGGTAVLMISHDLGVVRRLADRVVVMRAGEVVEAGPTTEVLDAPEHEYTRMLVAALPAGAPRGARLSPPTVPSSSNREPDHEPGHVAVHGPVRGSWRARAAAARADDVRLVLSARGLRRVFPARGAVPDRVAVDDVSLELRAGETLGLVGASGSGKTTTARLLLGLDAPDAGTVQLLGEPWAPLHERDRRARRPLLGAIYQDPASSFDPRLPVGRLLADALTGGDRTRVGSDALRRDVLALLGRVGLAADLADRGTASLSGGQRQRVAIARALAARPRVIVCDEPVSALDVSVQAQVLDLLDDLQREEGLAYLLISHDLDVVGHMADRVAVMQHGRVVEQGRTAEVFAAPRHEHTRALLAARP